MSVCDAEKCTGCSACASVCDCITMKQDGDGFYIPTVNENCVSCGKCASVCPVANRTGKRVNPLAVYTAWNRSDSERLSASSGGIFGSLSEKVISSGGAVFGAAFSEDYTEVLCKSTDEVPLDALKKSKYTESNMNGAITKIRAILDSGRSVLFCGTPCQAAGIRSVFAENENLIICDFVCHGVPSSSLYKAYLSWLTAKKGKSVKKVDFRCKKYGWKRSSLICVDFSDRSRYIRTSSGDAYLRMFYGRYALRKSCYSCNYVSQSRADITLGDAWKYKDDKRIRGVFNGASAVRINTEKGALLWSQLINTSIDGFESEYDFSPKKDASIPEQRGEIYRALCDGTLGFEVSVSGKIKDKALRTPVLNGLVALLYKAKEK